MGYTSRKGRRPNEYASKSSHSQIINDISVVQFLEKCNLPKNAEDVSFDNHELINYKEINNNPINFIIAIDGGYSEVSVRDEFPSSMISFFQFGVLYFSISDLDEISTKPFIDPEDISKLKNIQRFKLSLPSKNVILKDENSLVDSVRRTIYDFFLNNQDENTFIETLKWLVFEEYGTGVSEWNLARCPICRESNIMLYGDNILKDYSFECPYCKGKIYLTDIFRLHEAIDNEFGAGGILGYVTTLIEQILLVHIMRIILKTKPSLLNEILFIKDGPLAFFGQTANMYRPMRNLMNFLQENYNLYLAGFEKSGPFVEHADEISSKIRPGTILFLDNDYIYTYIIPGKADPSKPYGRTTYYGNKLIFKSENEYLYVVTLPTMDTLLYPKKDDFKNIDVIFHNISKLKCDMYDNSLLPVTLVNKLVSLADHPSSIILEKFAKVSMDNSQ
ncbi:NurA domain-containing protein [Candidatus Methanomarinus sp.]|nr:NurA domain-containing protein [ANME-2 cluster archaeon]